MTRHRSPTTSKNSQATALLALAAARRPVPAPCLNDEQLALLIDGRGGHEQKNLLAHLAHCPDCYQRWLLASDNRAALRGRLRRLRPVGLALAAAACLVLYLQVVELDETPLAPLPPVPQAILTDKAELSSSSAQTKRMPLRDKKEIPAGGAPPTTVSTVPLPEPAPIADGGASPQQAERLKGKVAAPPAAERAPSPAPFASSPAPGQLLSPEKEKKSAAAPPLQGAGPTAPTAVSSSSPAKAAENSARPLAETAAALAPTFAELGQWRRDLATACLHHESEPQAWRLLSERGQRLRHSHAAFWDGDGNVDTILLTLSEGIEHADSVALACRRILDELAKKGMDK
jgi:hypothetical protein